MAFITWPDVLTALQDRIADGDITVGSITVMGKTIAWHSPGEFWRHYNEVARRAAAVADSGAQEVPSLADLEQRGATIGRINFTIDNVFNLAAIVVGAVDDDALFGATGHVKLAV